MQKTFNNIFKFLGPHPVVTSIALLIAMATGAVALANTQNPTKKIRSLEFNMDQIIASFNQTVEEMNQYTFTEVRAANLKRAEQAYYDRVNFDFSNLRDNLLSHEAILNSVVNREANLQLINNTDIRELETEIRQTRDVYLSREHHTFDTYPVIEEGILRIAISIPVLTPSKEAKLYSIVKIPTFLNDTKFNSMCQQTHMLVYKGSSDWNTITIDEAMKCLQPKSRCEIKSTQVSAQVQNCASSQFFLKAHTVTLAQEEDTIPFAQSINDTIILSLPNRETSLEFHCRHMNRPGADRVLKVSGRSLIHNPFLCDYSLPEYGLSYSPVLDPSDIILPSFKGRFSISHKPMELPMGVDKPAYQFSYLKPRQEDESTPGFLSIQWTLFKKVVSVLLILSLLTVLILCCCLCAVWNRVRLPWKMPYNTHQPGTQVVPRHLYQSTSSSSEMNSDDEEYEDEEETPSTSEKVAPKPTPREDLRTVKKEKVVTFETSTKRGNKRKNTE